MPECSWILGSRSVDSHRFHDCAVQIGGFALVSGFLLDSGVQILWFSWISCLWPPDLKICMDFFDTGIHIH